MKKKKIKLISVDNKITTVVSLIIINNTVVELQ